MIFLTIMKCQPLIYHVPDFGLVSNIVRQESVKKSLNYLVSTSQLNQILPASRVAR